MNASDIITRPYDRKQQLWISHKAIVELCGVSDGYSRKVRSEYKQSIQGKSTDFLPDTGKSWRYGKYAGSFYYCYDNIPDRAPAYHRSKLPTLDELNTMLSVADKAIFDIGVERIKQLVADSVDNSNARYYMHEATPTFSPDRARELTTAKAWCDTIINELMPNYTDYGMNSLNDLWLTLSGVIPKMEGLRVSSPEYLRKLITRYKNIDNKLDFFISKNYGNQRAKVVGTMQIVHPETGEIMPYDIHESLFYSGFMNPFSAAKYSKVHIYNTIYVPACVNLDIEPLEYRTLCHYTNRFDMMVLTSKERHGSKHFNDTLKPYVPSQDVQFANSLWVADGSGSKLAYQARVKDGSKWATKQKSLYMVRIYDAASRYIVGYAIGESETPELVRQAIKMAVSNSNNVECLEFLTDNGSAFSCGDNQAIFSVLFRRVRHIKPGNSQGNYAETLVRLTTQHSRIIENEYDNFTVSSFEAKTIESQSNFDYFAGVKQLPTINQAYTQLVDIVNSWNNTPWGDGLTPAERFKNVNPQCQVIPDKALRFAFGNVTNTDLSYQRGFVNVEKNERQYQFIIPDYHVNIEHIARKLGYTSTVVQVRWDASQADLYTPEGAYIISCPAVEYASKSAFEASRDNWQALNAHNQRKEDITTAADTFRDNIVASAEAMPYGLYCKNGKSIVKDDFNQSHEEAVFNKINANVETLHATSEKIPTVRKKQTSITEEAFNQL